MASRLNDTRVQRLVLACAGAGIGVLLLVGLVRADRAVTAPAAPAAFVVDSTEDRPDQTVGDGQCVASNGHCTLRAAVEEANYDISTPDTIQFALAASSIITLSDELPISGALSIIGPGSDFLTINGQHEVRHFRITTCDNGVDTPVSISDLTLVNGRPPGHLTPPDAYDGGAISYWCNQSGSGRRQSVTLDSIVFLQNQALVLGGGFYAGKEGDIGSINLSLRSAVLKENSAQGGAIALEMGGEVSIENTQVISNSANSNPGILAYLDYDGYADPDQLHLDIQDSVFRGNSTFEGTGGAISSNARMTLTQVVFDGNRACEGGAIDNYGVLTIDHSSFHGNGADPFCAVTAASPTSGGAIYNAGSVTVNASTFITNTADAGGAIYNLGSVTANASTFSANTAATDGGAIYNSGGTVKLTNSTISGNEATNGSGGGVYSQFSPAATSTLSVDHVTITANKAGYVAGGVLSGVPPLLEPPIPIQPGGASAVDAPGVLSIANSIIAGNTVSGSGYYADCVAGAGGYGAFVTLGHNLTSSGTSFGCNFDATGDQKLPPADIFTTVLWDQLAENGGPTLTHALLPQSPAMDKIMTGCTVTTDQRGAPRPLGSGCDIGAVEAVVPRIGVVTGVCGVNKKGEPENCLDSLRWSSVEFGHKNVAVFYAMLLNAGNVALDAGTLSAPALGISERPVHLDYPVPPANPDGYPASSVLRLVTEPLTDVVSNTVTITAWNQTLEDMGIPTEVTWHATLEVRPVATTVEKSVSGTEQEATRTFKITASYPSGAKQTLPERSVGFQVTGGTVVSPTFEHTDEHGQAEFSYVSRAPSAQSAKYGSAADRPKAPAPLAPDDMDHVLLWVDLNNNSLADAGEPQYPYELPTAITLVSFTATPKPDGTVALAWTTGAEIDNAGFNLYRATSREGPYSKINVQLIAGQGNGWGASYSYVDTPPDRRVHYYRLEDVDYTGVGTFHDPIEVRGMGFGDRKRVYLPVIR